MELIFVVLIILAILALAGSIFVHPLIAIILLVLLIVIFSIGRVDYPTRFRRRPPP